VLAVFVPRHGHYHGTADNSTALTDLEVGGIKPETGPSTAPTVPRTVGKLVRGTDFMRIDPSSGRVRNAFTRSSISAQRRLAAPVRASTSFSL